MQVLMYPLPSLLVYKVGVQGLTFFPHSRYPVHKEVSIMADMSFQEHMEWLRGLLADYLTELSEAEATVLRLRPKATHLAETLRDLEAGERGDTPSEKLPPIDVWAEVEGQVHEQNSHLKNPSSPFTPGVKKSARMPDRQPEYADISIIMGARKILNSSSKVYHADELVTTIYNVKTREEFKAAKQTVVSELLRGESKGLWRKLGGNKYVRND